MNKSQLITIIKSVDTVQAQARYDHILTYLQSHKQYPRLRGLKDKINWFAGIDNDLGATISKMSDLGFITTSDYRSVARGLNQYHHIIIPTVVRIPQELSTGSRENSITVHNISNGVDISHGDHKYSRNLDTDLQKLLD